MSQIMRLRRMAGSDHHIEDRNNGHRHEHAFVDNIRANGLLHEADLLPDSYGGKLNPRAVPVLIESLPIVARALIRRKMTPGKALLHPHRKQYKRLKEYFDKVDSRTERLELNLYISGYDGEEPAQVAGNGPAMVATGTSGVGAPPAPRRPEGTDA